MRTVLMAMVVMGAALFNASEARAQQGGVYYYVCEVGLTQAQVHGYSGSVLLRISPYSSCSSSSQIEAYVCSMGNNSPQCPSGSYPGFTEQMLYGTFQQLVQWRLEGRRIRLGVTYCKNSSASNCIATVAFN